MLLKSFCVLILALSLASQVSAQTPPVCSLQGSVVDQSTGSPIPGASLTAISSSTITVTTTTATITTTTTTTGTTTADVNGDYCFEGLPEGSYDVTADATGYLPQTVTDVVIVPGVTTVQDFSLTPGSAIKEVDVVFKPETLNTNNKGEGVVTIKVHPPDGYTAMEIVPESVIIADIGGNMTNIDPIRWNMEDGKSVLMLKYNRQDVLDVLRLYLLTGSVEITVTGRLTDNTPIIGSDDVKVKNKK